MSAEPERLADVLPLVAPRARELASSSRETSKAQLASSADSFAQLVHPLEQLDGRPLHGPGRDDCAAAFRSHPHGFAAAVDEAAQASVRRRCGLLVKLIRDGYHVAADALADDVAAARLNRCGCSHPDCRFQDVCLQEVGE